MQNTQNIKNKNLVPVVVLTLCLALVLAAAALLQQTGLVRDEFNITGTTTWYERTGLWLALLLPLPVGGAALLALVLPVGRAAVRTVCNRALLAATAAVTVYGVAVLLLCAAHNHLLSGGVYGFVL